MDEEGTFILPNGQNVNSLPTGNQWILVSSSNDRTFEGIYKGKVDD